MVISIWKYHLVIKQFAMENPPIFKNGQPSINLWAIYFPRQTVSHNQRVNMSISIIHYGYYIYKPTISIRAIYTMAMQQS